MGGTHVHRLVGDRSMDLLNDWAPGLVMAGLACQVQFGQGVTASIRFRTTYWKASTQVGLRQAPEGQQAPQGRQAQVGRQK